ncbi:MAG: hypothetical protein A2698_01010 [Candidatus Levybacteria bacterium RIFCSPHIGHO2_01_FULL_42_15]|nr:MAG: hypothetical protein A2698_01010 [Candidatus Levybacteria bacterium RIFCSPHIGHO2_01_FULL_42_15]
MYQLTDKTSICYYVITFMNQLIKDTAIYSLSLYFVSLTLSGVRISGGITTFLLAGVILALLFILLRPVLRIITLPLFFLSFGSFSFIINAMILYVLTIVLPQIEISAFAFYGASFAGFSIPSASFNTFFAYVVSSIVLSLYIWAIRWVIKR